MNIIIPRFSMKRFLNQAWSRLRGTELGKVMTHQAQAPLALDLHRYLFSKHPLAALSVAKSQFGMELRGAGYGWESRRWFQPASDATIATTGANTVNFNILDFCEVYTIGFVWTVAGTVTALVMDFDRYPNVAAGGTVIDKLDGTNGVITAPTVAGQAIGNILYKDLTGGLTGSPGIAPVALNPGDSVQAIVTTTTTAGNGLPFVIGGPRAETYLNFTDMVRSS